MGDADLVYWIPAQGIKCGRVEHKFDGDRTVKAAIYVERRSVQAAEVGGPDKNLDELIDVR